jgi:cell division protein FtsN
LVSLTPNDNYWGTEVITFKAVDIPGLDPVLLNMTVTVNSVNDKPVLNDIDLWTPNTGKIKSTATTIEIEEDDAISIFVTAQDTADNDVLVFADDTELFDINTATGEIAFTPTNDDVGAYNVNISVDDQQTTNNVDWAVFNFIIKNVNDDPDTPVIIKPVDGDTYITDNEIEFEGTGTDVDLDIEDTSERLSYEWTTDQSNDVLSVLSEFTAKLEPGEYEITLTVKDRANKKASTSVTITVDIDRSTDTDGDGTPDYQDDDDDGDGMPDTWELQYSLDPLDASDATVDSDRDDFTNLEEYLGDDGLPGGDDSSNPKIRTSAPEKATSTEDGGDSSINSMYIIAILAVVIIVVILIVLFIVMKNKKKGKDDEQAPEQEVPPVETVAPTPQGTQHQTPMPDYGMGQYPPQQQGQGQGQMPMDMQMQYEQMQQMMNMNMNQQMPMQQPQQQPTGDMYGSAQTSSQMPMTDQQMSSGGQLPSTPEQGAGAGLGPVPDKPELLPSHDEPAVSDQPVQSTDDQGIDNIGDEPQGTDDDSVTGSCSKCGEPAQAGWVICPNCKEML